MKANPKKPTTTADQIAMLVEMSDMWIDAIARWTEKTAEQSLKRNRERIKRGEAVVRSEVVQLNQLAKAAKDRKSLGLAFFLGFEMCRLRAGTLWHGHYILGLSHTQEDLLEAIGEDDCADESAVQRSVWPRKASGGTLRQTISTVNRELLDREIPLVLVRRKGMIHVESTG